MFYSCTADGQSPEEQNRRCFLFMLTEKRTRCLIDLITALVTRHFFALRRDWGCLCGGLMALQAAPINAINSVGRAGLAEGAMTQVRASRGWQNPCNICLPDSSNCWAYNQSHPWPTLPLKLHRRSSRCISQDYIWLKATEIQKHSGLHQTTDYFSLT